MYIDRVERLRKFIADLPPRKLVMNRWVKVDKMPDGSIPSLNIMCEPSCNTAGCLAGWTVNRFKLWPKMFAADNDPSAQRRAASYFGLSFQESSRLFLMYWPSNVCGFEGADGSDYARNAFDKLKAARRKRIMLKVLDYIIKHGFTWIDSAARSKRITRYRKIVQ